MKKVPRIYCASIATETNTFSPLRTDLENFKETFYKKDYFARLKLGLIFD